MDRSSWTSPCAPSAVKVLSILDLINKQKRFSRTNILVSHCSVTKRTSLAHANFEGGISDYNISEDTTLRRQDLSP